MDSRRWLAVVDEVATRRSWRHLQILCGPFVWADRRSNARAAILMTITREFRSFWSGTQLSVAVVPGPGANRALQVNKSSSQSSIERGVSQSQTWLCSCRRRRCDPQRRGGHGNACSGGTYNLRIATTTRHRSRDRIEDSGPAILTRTSTPLLRNEVAGIVSKYRWPAFVAYLHRHVRASRQPADAR